MADLAEQATRSVFISYSHDSEGHRQWVLQLANRLCDEGLEVRLDQYDVGPGHDVAAYMNDSVSKSDKVILVCTEKYVDKVDAGRGGAGYENMIVNGEILARTRTEKFIPILRDNSAGSRPTTLASRIYVDFRQDSDFEKSLVHLLRGIRDLPAAVRPSKQPKVASVAITPSDEPANDPWFTEQRQKAEAGVKGRATMEVKVKPHHAHGSFGHLALRDAARASEIRTFGWPIGIFLDNEQSPSAVQDGIEADVRFRLDDSSYDHWAIRTDGSFYLRQTLFEDKRDPEAIFFNTRIVRVAESMLYIRRLYEKLALPKGSTVSFEVAHEGIAGRRLSVAGNRHLSPFLRKIKASESRTLVHFAHPLSDEQVPTRVKEILEPLFVLFDFFKLSDEVYQDIVKRFIGGEIS